ncbi:sarcosine oxidase subunit gamma [Leucobacter coleopterorum]|uniref:Sarcosine oxidase subunit gamma n=1 Tax=Leucobacter coleopterorum TaxID=2714933 RepID=A0ABX6JZ19_9MICO|nr:sarcosine oxidase subunit gamma family protein [Leucobacter coleopterorum]QIM18217.1 sarcosine oxidase subunit gamma [Leucobacter coleopterorum]
MVEIAYDLETLRVSPAAHLSYAMGVASAEAPEVATVREVPFALQMGLRCSPAGTSAQQLEQALGVSLPNRVGCVTGDSEGLHVIWLSPDEFLAVDTSRRQRPGDIVGSERSLSGLPGQAIDLSANRTIIELGGSRSREVLEKGCRADLHPRVFPAGTAIATQLGQVPLILHYVGDSRYRLFPRASFADFTVRWLIDAMGEFTERADE